MSLEPSTLGHNLAFLFFFSSYIITYQLVVGVLLTLASCIGDPCLLTILAYIKDYNPKLLVIIIIKIIKGFYSPQLKVKVFYMDHNI